MYTVKVEAGDFKAGKFSNFVSRSKAKYFELAIDKFGWTMSGLQYVKRGGSGNLNRWDKWIFPV